MNKNKFQYLIAPTLIIGFAFANCVSVEGARVDRVDDRVENRVDRVDDRVENRVDRVENRVENRVDRVENRVENRNERMMTRLMIHIRRIAGRFNALIARKHHIANRIQTRIIILEDEGFDMTLAKQAIELAQDSLETIQVSVDTMISEMEDAIATEEIDTQKLFAEFRMQTISLKQEMRNTHIQLVQSVWTIREAVQQGKIIEEEEIEEDMEEEIPKIDE